MRQNDIVELAILHSQLQYTPERQNQQTCMRQGVSYLKRGLSEEML